jgi:membrane associated rhomboid family serine protease
VGVGLFFIPVYIAGFLFGILYLLISGWLDKKGGGNINHSAHIFGALFGIAFTIVACQAFSDYPLLENFTNQVRNMSASDIFQTPGS